MSVQAPPPGQGDAFIVNFQHNVTIHVQGS